MKTHKILIYISAILAISGNPNWHWFFIVGLCMSFADYFYSDQREEKNDEKKSSGGGAVGW